MKAFFKKLKSKIGLFFITIDGPDYNGTYPYIKKDILQSLNARHHLDNKKDEMKKYFIHFMTYYQNKHHTNLLYECVSKYYPEYLNLLNTILLLK